MPPPKSNAKNCHFCGLAIEPTPAQVRRGDYTCRECRASHALAARLRYAERGGPLYPARKVVSPPRPPHEAWDAYRASALAWQKAKYLSDPVYRAKKIARGKVRRAVATGQLTPQPCEVCGAEPAEGHHDDYSRPLDVRWLCFTHHREHHANQRKAA